MFGKRKPENQKPSPYATRADFCQIFENDMNRLYRLSFLLTGDDVIAEQCFVGGLHIAQEGNPVFKEWAEAWARRAIILNAIRMIRPRLTAETPELFSQPTGDNATERTEIAEIVKLPVFERFAFVMSVLEGYSDNECALHLGCNRADVTAARTRALERIGKSAGLQRKLVSIASGQKAREQDPESLAQLQELTRMAASA